MHYQSSGNVAHSFLSLSDFLEILKHLLQDHKKNGEIKSGYLDQLIYKTIIKLAILTLEYNKNHKSSKLT